MPAIQAARSIDKTASIQSRGRADADQAELFAHHRNNEVGVAFGKKVQVRLGAQQPALAKHPARADGGLGLDNVPSGAQRIALRIEEGQNPLFLIVVHHEHPHGNRHGHRRCQHAEDPAPAQPAHEQHERTARQYQQGRTQVGLAHNQGKGHPDQHQADRHMLELRWQGPLGQIPGDGRRHEDFQELRRLEANHTRNIDPACGAHGVVAHDVHHHQQQHASQITDRYPAGHKTRFKLSDDEHRHQPDPE